MKLSRSWLSDFTNITVSDEEYADRLTLTGSKVEGIADLSADTKNVVLGQVQKLERHPDADTLWVCTIDIGAEEPIIIVTGAQNLAEGDFVPAALHKSKLPCGLEIKKGKLRGITSNGMLCSLEELCLDKNDYPYAVEDGILVFTEEEVAGHKLGDDICAVLGFDDKIIEFEITSNRPDCLSVVGLARETAASFGLPFSVPEPVVKGSGGDVFAHLDAEIIDEDLCRRFTARIIQNVTIAPSPHWMRRRLRAAGVRPINNIVDVTNYVMLEYGQPMHAFDHACLEGGVIHVRRSHPGEMIETLDGNTRVLDDAIVIADAHKAVGVAGVMGGASSEITAQTKTVVLESANFDGKSIRKTAQKLGMRTDASSRFEKGLDPMATLPAVARACELIEQIGAGEVVDGYIDVLAYDSNARVIALEAARINGLLGTEIPRETMVDLLAAVGFVVDANDQVTIPSWRGDVHTWADLAEEVARFYGYDKIPSTMFAAETTQGGFSPRQKQERAVGSALRAMGYNEILTYTFMGQVGYDKIRLEKDSPLRQNLTILNPLGEDTSQMRQTALPAMLEVLERNNSHRNPHALLYELGRVYVPNGESETLCDERLTLTLGAYGAYFDFYAIKGSVEALLEQLCIGKTKWEACTDHPVFHPGRAAVISLGDVILGRVGQVHPLTAKNFGFDTEVYVAELDLEALFANIGDEARYVPIPKFPSITRDIAVVCDGEVSVGDLQAVIEKAGGKKLVSCTLFDVYTGEHIAEGKKSVAFALSYRADDKTLTDEEADVLTAKILTALSEGLGAVIRA